MVDETVSGERSEGEEPPTLGSDDPEAPEADVLEQEAVVDEEQILVAATRPEEATEADWRDQSIIEPIDDEER